MYLYVKLQGAGVGILFIAPRGEELKYALQLLFSASNNAAEYEALIHGLNIAISLGIKRLMVYGDSMVVIRDTTDGTTIFECSCEYGESAALYNFGYVTEFHFAFGGRDNCNKVTIEYGAERNLYKLRSAILGTLAKNTYFCPTNIE